jgi:hypothetical protein
MAPRWLACASAAAAAATFAACASPPPPEPTDADPRAVIEPVLDDALRRMTELADSIDDLLRPVPLLTPAQESALRRYGNAEQLARARALGVRPRDAGHLAELLQEGRLVELEDSTELWVVRELDYSGPFLTPDAHALLGRVGERFQERLAALGLPAYRLEVTSVLRTPADQAALRRVNPNAAAGESTHEYGTTLDVLYASFAAPAEHGLSFSTGNAGWLEPHLDRVAAAILESAAARKSRELQAVLGAVLTELQQAGDVLVTLERQQPVYHFTVARRQGSS